MNLRKARDYTTSFIGGIGYLFIYGNPPNPQHYINQGSTGQTSATQLQIPKSADHKIDSNLNPIDGCNCPECEVIQAQNISHPTVPQGPEVGRDDKRQYDDKKAIIKELEEKVKSSEERTAKYRKSLEKMYKERSEDFKELYDVRKALDKSQKEVRASREGYRMLKEKQNGLKKDHDTALAQIARQKVDINELTVKISHSLKTNGTTTRGDDYFEAKFSSLEGAIRQFIFRSFRNVSNLALQDLIPTARESLNATTFKDNSHPNPKVDIKEIEAAVTERLRAHVFRPSFLLEIQERYYDIGSISSILGGTYLKRREWHAQTVAKMFENDRYDDHLQQRISCVESDLQTCFSFLLQGDAGEKHRKSLLAIIEQAARLQKEIFCQVSLFELHPIKPGDKYDPSYMDDMSSLVDEEGVVEAQSFIVRVAIFPAIVRWGFDEDGKESGAIIVRKATVIAMLNGQEEIAGLEPMETCT